MASASANFALAATMSAQLDEPSFKYGLLATLAAYGLELLATLATLAAHEQLAASSSSPTIRKLSSIFVL